MFLWYDILRMRTLPLFSFYLSFRKNEHPKKAPPSFYQVTNHSKERPDVWIDSPEKSVFCQLPPFAHLKQKNWDH